MANKSKKIVVTTMDTTSHDFTWQTFEFGGVNGSSYFSDVAIIDENDIWAVGEIHTKDTDQWNADSTQWVQPYNAAHWDGEKWELKRIYFHLCPNSIYLSAYPIEAIFSINKNNIWFTEGGSIVTWDGVRFKQDCSVNKILTGGIRKIWGTSDRDLYIVGTNGFIAHYDGKQWTRIESGTNTMIQDIWGIKDNLILCAIAPGYGASNSDIYQIKEDRTVATIPWVEGRAVRSIWFNNPVNIFTCGSGVFKREINGKWKELAGKDVLNVSTERIRGMANNDLFIVGHFGAVMHFNGMNFKVYPKLSSGIYYSCDYKNGVMIAVGFNNKFAFVLTMQK